jgi:hypothetical protein
MNEPREKLFFHWSDSIQKFDYYFTGLVAAVVVYCIKEYQPARLGLNPTTLEFGAIVVLGIALLASIIRMESLITLLRITHDLDPKKAWLERLKSRPAGQPIAKASSPNVNLSDAEIEAEIRGISEAVERAELGRDRLVRKSKLCHAVRNMGFLIGVFAIFAAKVLTPYWPLLK